MTIEATNERRRSGRPKLPEDQKRRELRVFVSAHDAQRLRTLGEAGGVSEGAILALLWRLVGEAAWNDSLRFLCEDTVDLKDVAGIFPSIHEGIASGKVRIVSTENGLKLSGASVRAWVLR